VVAWSRDRVAAWSHGRGVAGTALAAQVQRGNPPRRTQEPPMTDAELQSLEYTYQQLVKGAGRELVNDDNVDALIRRAEQDDHRVLATELREWQAACGRDVPSTIAPTAGFNRENAKR
jgi:hypothetical protein